MKAKALAQASRVMTAIVVAGAPLLFTELHAEPMKHDMDMKHDMMMRHDMMMMGKPSYSKLIALINPVGDSKVKGTVVFEKVGDGVKVTVEIGGLNPNSKHGFHIHEFGDLGSADASSAGGHFNPGGHPHAMPDKTPRHAGDLGNLEADDKGVATKTLTVKDLNLCAGPMGILGRAVIVHAKEDDGSQPTGNSGDRIGAGVIGVSKDAKVEGMDMPMRDMDMHKKGMEGTEDTAPSDKESSNGQ